MWHRAMILFGLPRTAVSGKEWEGCRYWSVMFFSQSFLLARFPNHKDHKRIEEEHTEELKKLRTEDADYHHGLHTGCLAASRLFQSQSDILKINEYDEVSEEMMELAKEHSRKIAESLVAFPHVAVDQK